MSEDHDSGDEDDEKMRCYCGEWVRVYSRILLAESQIVQWFVCHFCKTYEDHVVEVPKMRTYDPKTVVLTWNGFRIEGIVDF